MKLEQKSEMPKKGQFVAMWRFNGTIWSGNYRWDEGFLMEYSDEQDDWISGYGLPVSYDEIIYFVVG